MKRMACKYFMKSTFQRLQVKFTDSFMSMKPPCPGVLKYESDMVWPTKLKGLYHLAHCRSSLLTIPSLAAA